MKRFLILLITLVTISCTNEMQKPANLLDFVPKSSAVIFRSNQPDLFFTKLLNNELFKNNQDFPIYKELQEELAVLGLLPLKDPSFLSLSRKNAALQYLYITNSSTALPTADSLSTEGKEISVTKTDEGNRYEYNDKVAYSSIQEGVFLLSNSKELLQEAINREQHLQNSADFQIALKAASRKKPVIFINHDKIQDFLKRHFKESSLAGSNRFSHWTVLDTEINQDLIKLNGITTATDSVPRLINVFKNNGPAENMLADITPAKSNGFYSFTFKDFNELKDRLSTYRGKPSIKQDTGAENMLQNASEAGMVYLEDATVFAIRSTVELPTPPAEAVLKEEFREVSIYAYTPGEDFSLLLQPLVSPGNLQYYAILDNFMVFSESSEAVKALISSFKNGTDLASTEAYKSISENLSTQASILAVSNNRKFASRLAENLSEELQGTVKELNVEGFPLAATQFIYQDDFAHVHAIMNKSGEVSAAQSTGGETTVHLGGKVVTNPVFFKNHRTNGMDIAVQDDQNILYLISPEGNIYWKKNLASRIQGRIQSVDILRNGRYQLAFATQDRLHVIDRDGNTVKPFPLAFNDPITQPLSVFDYERNRDYRFVITQGRELYMYDRKGNRVKGFDFDKASEAILHPPKHIRIGKKDYILVAEASGKLNILSRTGKIRVPVKEQLDLSDNDWYENRGSFISTNDAGEILRINERGKVSREATGFAENPQITATEQLLVGLSENILSIGSRKLTLDFGLYTTPQTFQINGRTLIGLTDLQAKKVYVFDSEGELLSGFPRYGNSAVDISNADKDAALELTVKGDEEAVLIYQL